MKNRSGWRTLSLLVAGTAIFAGAAQAKTQDPCFKLKKIVPSYDALRQNNSIELDITLEASKCTVRFRHSGSGDDPSGIKLGLQHTDGITPRLKGVSFGNIEPQTVTFAALQNSSTESRMRQPARAHKFDVYLELQSSPDIALGHYQIPAFVQYEAADKNRSTTESSVFLVSVDVVPANALVKQHFEQHRMTVADAFLIPVRLVELVGELLCGFCHD